MQYILYAISVKKLQLDVFFLISCDHIRVITCMLIWYCNNKK